MSKRLQHGLSKRERQIMDVIYRTKGAGVSEVRDAIPDPPGYSAVRTTLNILEQKGLLTHQKDGRRYRYLPKIPHRNARQSAISRLLHIYFDDSIEAAVTALIRFDHKRLTKQDYDNLVELIRREEAKK